MRVRPLGQSKREAKYAVWSIADITRDRERQEDVFQELQHAIEYLDHAPCGFFSVNPAGDIVYVNATLANWLDHDLAEIGSGGLKLTDIVSGDGAALLTSIVPVPGEVKTEVFDIDLRMRGGKTMPVRLYHKLAFGADGAPGASRTLVISRARDEHSDPRARRRSPLHALLRPYADGDRDRGPRRRGGARQCPLRQAGAEPQSAKARRANRSSAPSIARDRGLLIAAINQAAEGQGDIAPVEAMLDGAKERWGQFFVTAVEEDERETEAAIVYMLETTERRTLENQINQSQKMDMVGQLAGGIAHDFNNVLSAIMMANDFLLNAHKPTDPSFQDIMQIKQNATRAATLVRQLLAFSRRQTLRPQVLDLGDALSDLTMLLRRLIGEKVKLDLVHGRDLWPVKVDVSQFEQVIVNLAVNARDAMPDGGKLTVQDRQRDGGRIRAALLQGHAGGGLCADRRHPTPAPAFPPRSSTRSSSRSSRPRKSARAPGSACRRSMASSSRPAASSMSTPSPARAPRSASSCRGIAPSRRPQPEPHGRQRRGQGRRGRAAEAAARPDRAGHHPAGRGRGGLALAECARPALARLQRDRGLQRHRGDGSAGARRTAPSISSFPTW